MRTLLALLVLVVILPGCTLSVHPILTDADLTKDLDLSGTWQQQLPRGADPKIKPIVISCEGYDDNTSYDAAYEGLGQEFDVRIGRIGDRRYLQFIRSDLLLSDDAPVLAKLPVYGFARFEMKADELHAFAINDQEVRKLLQRKDVPYRDYEPSDMLKWCVLTARTSELQSLIRDSGDELFGLSPIVFRRIAIPSGDQNE